MIIVAEAIVTFLVIFLLILVIGWEDMPAGFIWVGVLSVGGLFAFAHASLDGGLIVSVGGALGPAIGFTASATLYRLLLAPNVYIDTSPVVIFAIFFLLTITVGVIAFVAWSLLRRVLHA